MKIQSQYQKLIAVILILAFVQSRKIPKPSSLKCNLINRKQEDIYQESTNKDEIAKQIFTGVAKSFNIKLTQQTIDLVTYSNFQIESLESALNKFGSVMIDQSYLKDTLSDLRNIFISFSNALAQSEESKEIIKTFLNVFQDENTFNNLKIKLFEEKSIDCQLYLWGALDYLIFDQYQVIGETFGRVVYLMSQYQTK